MLYGVLMDSLKVEWEIIEEDKCEVQEDLSVQRNFEKDRRPKYFLRKFNVNRDLKIKSF